MHGRTACEAGSASQAQEISLNYHCKCEQYVHFASGGFFNFNGTAGAWCAAAVSISWLGWAELICAFVCGESCSLDCAAQCSREEGWCPVVLLSGGLEQGSEVGRVLLQLPGAWMSHQTLQPCMHTSSLHRMRPAPLSLTDLHLMVSACQNGLTHDNDGRDRS